MSLKEVPWVGLYREADVLEMRGMLFFSPPLSLLCAAESSSPQAGSHCKDNRQASRCLSSPAFFATTLLSVCSPYSTINFPQRFPAASFLATETLKRAAIAPTTVCSPSLLASFGEYPDLVAIHRHNQRARTLPTLLTILQKNNGFCAVC